MILAFFQNFNLNFFNKFYIDLVWLFGTPLMIILSLLSTLVPVAYYTIFERKVLAAMQRRRGPNSVGFWGLLQPLADGLKLMTKEGILPWYSVNFVYTIAPILSMVISFASWHILPLSPRHVIGNFDDVSVLFYFCITSLSTYGVVLAGWGSYSRYAVMGGIRAVSQMISYELLFLITVLPAVLLANSFSFINIVEFQTHTCWNIITLWPFAIVFFILLLAETNRTPFDLPEAEAELVSGFNVEYGSILFAMFFLAEYNSMLAMSAFYSLMFLGGWGSSMVFFYLLKIIFVAFLIVLARAELPRYRFDQLIALCWKSLLPIVLAFTFLQVYIQQRFNLFLYNYDIIYREVTFLNESRYIRYGF